jgi:hypothetical protein
LSGRELRQASIHAVRGQSLVVPLEIDGLPATIDCLGRRWQRKREFHLTALAGRLLSGIADAEWEAVVRVASGRILGPIRVGDEFRRVRGPEQSELETIVVMAECRGLEALIDDLAHALGRPLPIPPAHVTLYSTDPAEGIGLTDQQELAERAPPLTPAQRDEVRRALAGEISR